MVERKNTGLAVSDAKRLNDCYRELSEAIAARPEMPGDRKRWHYDYAALEGGPAGAERKAWNHKCGSNNIAEDALRGAVSSGKLQLWTNDTKGEAKVDRHELKELTFRTFASGTYQPDNRRLDNAGLAESPLWVKEADWQQYMADVWSVRYGIDWANPAPPAEKPLLPPEAQFVTLSHALTWIAFGVSMDNHHLHEVQTFQSYGELDPYKAIKAALDQLVSLARAGKIALEGKFRADPLAKVERLRTTVIGPTEFADFRQFDILEDALCLGCGLTWDRQGDSILDHVMNDRGSNSYINVSVNREDLLRQFRPHGPLEIKADAILWSDLEPAELDRVEAFACEAESDEWWNWPQAVAWAGCRKLEHVASMRLCAEPWKRNRRDLHIALGAEHFLGTAYCTDLEMAERSLQSAIERGAIATQGRASEDGPSRELKPTDWRGGKVVYNRTATLVSAANLLSEWACDVAVNRADLWREFPAESTAIEAKPTDGKKSRGRAKGTGYQRADAPLLKRMAEAIADNLALNATSAAKLVAPEAEGASFEAKVDRLARAYRAGRNGE